jgi:hypothetical protein
MSELSIEQLRATRRTAIAVDLAAVAASLAANIAAAPRSVGGWLVAAVAPVGLFLAIVLWHRSHGVLAGWLSPLFNVGLASIAAGAAWISFGHLQEVAERFGQSPGAAAVIPLVIDGAAVLATIVVISAGQRITELETAEANAAQAEHEAQRARADAERQATEHRRAAEARLASRKVEPPAPPTPVANQETDTTDARRARSQDTATAIADFLLVNPTATAIEVAAAVGVSDRTVKRSAAWRSRPAAKPVTNGSTTTGEASNR